MLLLLYIRVPNSTSISEPFLIMLWDFAGICLNPITFLLCTVNILLKLSWIHLVKRGIFLTFKWIGYLDVTLSHAYRSSIQNNI